ncbi:hypothetical protein THIOSC15_1590002 [uncultured Thiomicrorhabdus sp.]
MKLFMELILVKESFFATFLLMFFLNYSIL